MNNCFLCTELISVAVGGCFGVCVEGKKLGKFVVVIANLQHNIAKTPFALCVSATHYYMYTESEHRTLTIAQTCILCVTECG